ncbi:AMP-binding protein [Methanothermobacter wolfeii]|uniref:AMP-binding protein n=1 Tax=Methanothermobacter wolfeii TaxID=145261 RepID=A0A9E7RR22_METWO|nr:AMP-binding protein [Methanothermobacter wolfeii]NLM03124.1 AMP-binding protein [Methanothermobacter wolfeii]UXH30955.1 AMP-binding protein [Methanothermobacter wolfeii]SCM57361.1 putative acyl-CoA synthetase YngI [Methanothermobacter wolfeii]
MVFTEDTIGEFFEKQVERYAYKEFIVYPDRDLRFTYREFNDRVNLMAKGLLSIGIKKGDHVGIWATNVPDWLTFLFATAKIGAVLVTVNTAYRSHELEYVMKQSDMKAIAIIDGFRDVDYIQTLYELVPELKTHERGHLRSERFPELRSVIYIGAQKHRGMYNTHELMLLGRHVPDSKLEEAAAELRNTDVINMQYTSGTTGFPKGVMLTHRNILNNGYYIGERQRFTEEDRLCLPVPLFHCFGIVLGVLAILTHGGTLVMIELFDPLLVLAAVEKEKCTALYGVPTMFIAEFTHPMFDMFDLSSLRTGIMAGSPCPIEAMKRVMNDMNMKEVTIAYGLTEASPVFTQTSVDDPIEKRVETVGTPLPHIEVKIVDPETGEELGPGEPGEICCRGYNVMKGYYKMPEMTAEAIDEDGWLHSGDLAVMDEDGYYSIVGRIKDMIIRGGENIYPREIEEFLHTMPGVKDVQVVGIPDEKYGEIVGAFIIKEDDADLLEEDVRDYAIQRIARYKVPKHVFFVDEFPLTASGKVQKFKLREMAVELLKKKET